jgi:sugar/nucleoside kinase (ribokinase family)
MSREASCVLTLRDRLKRAAPVDVFGIGESSVDEIWSLSSPLAAGGKLRAEGRTRLGGGQIATTLVACARLGLRAGYGGPVGADDAGRWVLDGLRAEGVDVTSAVVGDGPTREALLLVEPTGERTVIERHGKQTHFTPRLTETRVVHLDATHVHASLAAAEAARAQGAIVSLDVDHAAPGLPDLLPLVDICVTSAGVPELLSGERELGPALRALESKLAPGGLAGCTLGAGGAAALDGEHLMVSPAFELPVVDTTACGDTFHAGFLCALLDGKSPGEALRFANAAAGLKCRALGRTGCPTRSDVDSLLARS